MARVTVEDCLEYVDNRFNLVLVASKRARDISKGKKHPLVPAENDKWTVVALREIAEGKVTQEYLQLVEEPEDHVISLDEALARELKVTEED